MLAAYGQVARVVVVDNCSPDDSWERLQRIAGLPKVVLLQSGRNGGYGAGNNVGLRYCLDNPLDEPRQLVMVANPDTMISEPAIIETVECFKQHPRAIVCAPWQHVTSTGRRFSSTAWRLPSAGIYIMQFFALLGKIFRMRNYRDDELTQRFSRVDCVTGALFIIDAELLAKLGYYDEEVFLYCEETGLGKRADGIYEMYVCTQEHYSHEVSASIQASLPSIRKRAIILAQSRKRVLLSDYKVSGLRKLETHVCYFVAIVEAYTLAWAYY
ncbi:MAG: glycosyltransferase, partial [Eggerthellaceae bacterium]